MLPARNIRTVGETGPLTIAGNGYFLTSRRAEHRLLAIGAITT